MALRARGRTGVALGTVACLVSCMAVPVTSEEPLGPQAPRPALAAPVGTPLAQQLVFDVDPLRASAFERPGDTAPSTWPLGVYMPAVAHDLESGKTTVTLQVSSAGQPVTDLALTVAGDRPLAGPAPTLGALRGADATRTVALVFDNPAAAPFTITLDFAGRALAAEAAPPRRVQAVGLTATASSSYSGYAPARAIDGNLGTEWMDAPYRAPEASLTLDMGALQALTNLKVKMKPQSGGAYYRLEVSANGTTFTPATGNLKNTSWNLETKALPAGTQGRYLRLHFFNDAASPETRFSVFEAQVTGTPTGGSPAPTPTPPAATPTPPTPSLTPTPASPTPLPSGSGLYSNTFESYALGADPADFIDPNNEGYAYSWMPRVRWRVADYQGSKQYMHDGLNSKSYLNFRRYKGTALGTLNGLLPARYFAEATVTPIRSYTYAPTGDQGTQHYYLDPTHYVELLIKPNLFEVWACNNAQPFTSTGWQRLYFTSVSNPAGTPRRLGAAVDANTHTIKAYLDGVLKTTLTHAMLSTQPHWFALRGTGNIVVHDNVRIERR